MDGIPVKVIYSRRKSLSMKFDKTGILIVNAPTFVSEGEVRTFLREHTRWIRLNYVKALDMAENLREHEFKDGGKVLYLGKEYLIRVSGRGRVVKTAEEFVFPEGADAAVFERWLKARAKEYLPVRLRYRAYEMGISYRDLKISGAKSRWGSCSETGMITLSWRLMMSPEESIEYVIIHELCHRLHMDHSKDFWAEVEKFMPDYKKHKKWLDDHGYLME